MNHATRLKWAYKIHKDTLGPDPDRSQIGRQMPTGSFRFRARRHPEDPDIEGNAAIRTFEQR